MSTREHARRQRQSEYDSTHCQRIRNLKGQFATPYDLAVSIARDALGRIDSPRNFLEPSCGTGAFVSAIRTCAPNIRITGIEKDTTVFDIASELWSDNLTSIQNCDFFDFTSGATGFDLLITNPPYSRHHHLTAKDKARYGLAVEKLSGYHLSPLAGLHAYFIIAGTSLLNPGGIASWLIPSELFSVNYGKTIKNYITHDVTIERVHFFNNNSPQFNDALVSSCVLVLRKKPTEAQDMVLVTAGDFTSPNQSEKVPVTLLTSIEKWQHFFHRKSENTSSRVGDFFSVTRGLSTGSESFYAKTREEWHILGISDEWLTPVLPSPRFMHSSVINADPSGWPIEHDRALLNIPIRFDEKELPAAVRAYLATCPDSIRHNYTSTHRKKWYAIEQRKPAPIVCTYMSRSDRHPFRFVRNKSKAVVTTTYLCLYPNGNFTERELDEICISLNSIEPATLINSSREYGGGLRKLEPKELLSIPFTTTVTPATGRLF